LKYLGGVYEEEGLNLFLFQVGVSFYWAWSPFFLIVMLKEDPKYLLTVVFTLMLSILSWWLLPAIMGIVAIDFGKYISTIPNLVYLTYYVQKRYGFGKPNKSSLVTLLLVATFLAIILIIGLHRRRFVDVILWTSVMVCTFLLLLFAFRVLKKEDITYIKNVIHPGKMLSEIRSDFEHV
jgi:hypothetical protein